MTVDISVLGPMERIHDAADVRAGEHGVFLRRGDASGLLLPQVAPAWGWDAHELLRQLCRKADLPEDAWHDPSAELYRFTADVFEEE